MHLKYKVSVLRGNILINDIVLAQIISDLCEERPLNACVPQWY